MSLSTHQAPSPAHMLGAGGLLRIYAHYPSLLFLYILQFYLLLTPSTLTYPTTMSSSPVTETGTFVHGNTTAPEHPGVFSVFSLKGKTAIVSGSGAGIGLAVAHALAEAGANVAMFYNSNEDCKKRAAGIAQKYGVQGSYSWSQNYSALT